MRNKLISILLTIAMIVTVIIPTNVLALTTLDLTINENLSPPEYKSAAINDVLWEVYRPGGSTGTGVFDPFLRIQKNGDEQGYNTNDNPVLDAKTGVWTHALLMSDVPLVSVTTTLTPPGTTPQTFSGREILLDINETASTPNVDLERFQIWLTSDPLLNNYNISTHTFPVGSAYKVWDLGDNKIMLDYAVNTGSGGGDYRVLIPESYFQAALATSGLTASTAYMVLFSDMNGSDAGFEEWGIKKADTGNLKLIKVDQFGNSLPGAVFEISTTSDFAISTVLGTTDSNGFILANTITTGTYYVREKTAPAGYVKSNEVKTVIINKDLLTTVSFTNTEVGNLKIIKIDQFENLIPGAVFELSSTSDFAVATVIGTTNSSGEILVNGLNAGTYYVREKTAPAGYIKSTEVKTVMIDKDALATVYFTNIEIGDLKIIKVDQFENWVPGAVFEMSDTNDFANPVVLGTTDSNGVILVNGISAGVYYIREKTAPLGYIKSTEVKMVTIDKDVLATVTFINTEIGGLKIIKIDQFEHAVPGAVFELSSTSDFAVVTTLGTTDANGEIIVTGITAGVYYVREKTAPAGYVKSTEVKMVTIDKDEVATVFFTNIEIGDLKIIKIDQFENRVAGAVFEISDTNDFASPVVLGTTNSTGLIDITGMIAGTYYIREKTAPAGYVKSTEVKMITIDKDVVATVYFTNIEIGDLKIVKIDQFENFIPGAVFDLSTTSDFAVATDIGTTNAQGEILVTGLAAGTYYVREKTAPAGYIKSTEVKTVTIDKDLVATVYFTNIEIGDLKIIKIDQFENHVAGAVFELSKTNDFAMATDIGTTDAQGEILVTGLAAGTYYVREKTAPAGYIKSTEVKTVTIDKDLVATVYFTNIEINDLKIIKIDQFENHVAGAVFELSTTSDFAVATDIGTTDAQGEILVTGLAAGTYYVREKTAPAGYVKSTEVKTVTIDKDLVATVYFMNTEIGDLKIVKVDQINQPVPGAVFEISESSDFEDTTVLGTTDSQGFITVTGIVAGTYYIREKSAPLGYIKSMETKMVTIDKDLLATVYFTNTEIGDLKIVKIDQFENLIPGAVFELSTTSDFEESTIAGTTNAQGEILVEGLAAGTYFVREATGPLGYIKSDEVKTVTIDKDLVATVYFVNIEVGDLKLIKMDRNENPVPGAVFELSLTSDFEVVTELGTTDSEGFILVTDLQAGTYYIREKTAPAGYIKSDAVEMVTIDKDELAMVYFMNIEIGDLKIVKIDQFENMVPGAVFEISDNSDFEGVTELGTTDSEGVINVTGLEAGIYYVREKTAPAGYIKSDAVEMVTIDKDEVATVYFLNVEIGDLRIVKVDQFGASVTGAQFELSKTSNFEESTILALTDEDGLILVTGLEAGTYYVREKAAPTGYILSTDVKTVEISKDAVAEVSFTNEKNVTLRILKKDASTLANLSGVVFGIYTDEACTTLVNGIEYTTDINGEINLVLNDGTYYIRENLAPVGYKLDPTPLAVTITGSELQEITIYNALDETEEEEDPQTATNDYFLLALGLLLLISGGLVFVSYRRTSKK